jgi:hypothetical protein
LIPVVVLTCARPEDGEPFRYLDATIAQLEAERPGVTFDGIVVCDNTRSPASPKLPHNWALHSFTRAADTIAGNKLAYWEALRVGLSRETDAAIVFEDDVLLCPNALRRMATFPIPPDLGFVMFYSPAVFQNPRVFPGLWRTPTPVIGTQAIKFSRAALRKLDEFSHFEAFNQYHASDQILELARAMLGMKYGAHCPEIVQHVGDESAVDLGADLSHRWRHAQTFARQLDAMALYARDELFR